VTVSGDGIHTIEYNSRDLAGNKAVVKNTTISIDGVAPTIVFHSPNNSTFGGSELVIKLKASDDRSGLLGLEYKLDNGSFIAINTWTATLKLTDVQNGNHTITLRAVDMAGNINESSLHFSVNIKNRELFALSSDYALPIGLIAVSAIGVALMLITSRRRREATSDETEFDDRS